MDEYKDSSPVEPGMIDNHKAQHDRQLLLLTAGGDEAAFRELFDDYQPQLLYFIYRIVRNMSAAEEIVQDVFLKIWLTREALAEVQNFKSYLFTISRNQALNLLDKELRLRNRQANYEKDAIALNDEAETLPYHLIDEAIHSLPQQQQTAWLLSRHEGLSYQEIAGRMNISEKTVKRHIRLATDSIKDYLLRHNTDLLILLLFIPYL